MRPKDLVLRKPAVHEITGAALVTAALVTALLIRLCADAEVGAPGCLLTTMNLARLPDALLGASSGAAAALAPWFAAGQAMSGPGDDPGQ